MCPEQPMQPDLRCHHHPSREAVGQCDRCGDLLCAHCLNEWRREQLCARCLKDAAGDTARANWAWIVVGLYALIILVFTWPLLTVAFLGELRPTDPLAAYVLWPYWAMVAVMLLCEGALLVVPVRVANGRPVTRRGILLPILTSGFLMGCLALGGVLSIGEFLSEDPFGEPAGWGALGAGFAVWAAWAIVFARLSRGREPADVVSRQCRLLLKGSILELLVAVPTHIVARWRDYCCAGFATFVGLAFGLSVMLFSFGPGVLLLYVWRWKRLQPGARDAAEWPGAAQEA